MAAVHALRRADGTTRDIPPRPVAKRALPIHPIAKDVRLLRSNNIIRRRPENVHFTLESAILVSNLVQSNLHADVHAIVSAAKEEAITSGAKCKIITAEHVYGMGSERIDHDKLMLVIRGGPLGCVVKKTPVVPSETDEEQPFIPQMAEEEDGDVVNEPMQEVDEE